MCSHIEVVLAEDFSQFFSGSIVLQSLIVQHNPSESLDDILGILVRLLVATCARSSL